MSSRCGARSSLAIVAAVAVLVQGTAAGAQVRDPWPGGLAGRHKWASETAEGQGPRIVSAVPDSDTSVALIWASVDAAVGYRAFRRVGFDGPWTPLNVGLLTDTGYTDASAKPGVTYSYYIEAFFQLLRPGIGAPVHVSTRASQVASP